MLPINTLSLRTQNTHQHIHLLLTNLKEKKEKVGGRRSLKEEKKFEGEARRKKKKEQESVKENYLGKGS